MAKIRRARTDGPEMWIDPRKPYDWDKDDDDGGWNAPLPHPDFWRGVVCGALAEAVAFLLIFVIFRWW
jgi:hypothetical protein